MTVVTNRFEPWGLHLLFNQPPIDFLFSSWLIEPFDLLQVRCSHTLIKDLFLANLLSAELTNRNWIWNNLVRIASLKILIILKQALQHQDVVNDRNCSVANETVDNLNKQKALLERLPWQKKTVWTPHIYKINSAFLQSHRCKWRRKL